MQGTNIHSKIMIPAWFLTGYYIEANSRRIFFNYNQSFHEFSVNDLKNDLKTGIWKSKCQALKHKGNTSNDPKTLAP